MRASSRAVLVVGACLALLGVTNVGRAQEATAVAGRFPQSRLLLFSARSSRSYLEAGYRPGDALVFGRESVGLPRELLEEHAERVYGIPTMGAVRSLNLAHAAGIILYEA